MQEGERVALAADAEPGPEAAGTFAADEEVGRDLAMVDWAATPLGLPGSWPQSLQTAVDILLSSRFSMWMAWGPQLTFFCNAAYRRHTLGRKYPWALGRSASEVWEEIWDDGDLDQGPEAMTNDAGEGDPATVRAAGDIDLTNVGQFQAALDQAAATSSAITADMTAVTYCDSATIRALFLAARQARLTIQVSRAGPINEILLKVSGLDQVATVVTLD